MFCARLFICALWSPAGKGLTSWLSFVVSSVSLSLSHWYPGSGVVLDCIDSWSLHHYLLLEYTLKSLPLGKFCILLAIIRISFLLVRTVAFSQKIIFNSLYTEKNNFGQLFISIAYRSIRNFSYTAKSILIAFFSYFNWVDKQILLLIKVSIENICKAPFRMKFTF